jgi:hypothetical protein
MLYIELTFEGEILHLPFLSLLASILKGEVTKSSVGYKGNPGTRIDYHVACTNDFATQF